MFRGFQAIRAEFGAAVELRVHISPKISSWFRKTNTEGDGLQYRTNARLVSMMDNITAGRVAGVTGGFELPHGQTLDLWTHNCSVGVRGLRYDLGHFNPSLSREVTREEVAQEMNETMSTKVVEMMAVGLPVLVNPFAEHTTLLGTDYPLWWGEASPEETEADAIESFKVPPRLEPLTSGSTAARLHAVPLHVFAVRSPVGVSCSQVSIATMLRSPETLVRAGCACFTAANSTFSESSFATRLLLVLEVDLLTTASSARTWSRRGTGIVGLANRKIGKVRIAGLDN